MHYPSYLAWRKSSRSASNGDCVELAALAEHVVVRDSKNRGLPVLSIARRDFRRFVFRVRAKELDL
jgi:hypothetical protein